MLIRIWRASDSDIMPCQNAYLVEKTPAGRVWMVRIDTLEDLKELNRECKVPLIVDFVGKEKQIVIYDYLRDI